MLEDPQLLEWVKEAALDIAVGKIWVVNEVQTFSVMYGSEDDPNWGYILQIELEECHTGEIQYIQVPGEDEHFTFFAKMNQYDIIELIYHDRTESHIEFTPHLSQFIFPLITSENDIAKRR